MSDQQDLKTQEVRNDSPYDLWEIFKVQMDILCEDFRKYANGDPRIPFAVVRESVIAVINAYEELPESDKYSCGACLLGHYYGRKEKPDSASPAGDVEARGHIAMLRSLRLMYEDGVMGEGDHIGTTSALDAAIAALSAPKQVGVVDDDWHLRGYAYASKQATNCAACGEHKHTPLRVDAMGGYVCLTCIDKRLGSLLGEFGYGSPQDERDREIGRRWREDSSLETWFPFTAEELKKLRAKVAERWNYAFLQAAPVPVEGEARKPVAFAEMVEDEWRFRPLRSASKQALTRLRHGAHLFLTPPPSQPAVELERYEDIEAIATCLDEDAAAMLEENPEDERAHNMQRASEILTALIDGAKAGREEGEGHE